MPESAELLDVARQLAFSITSPSDAQLRRAVSTAYYALFHKVAGMAARRYMGEGAEGSAGYSLLYRSFDHGHMKRICNDLDVPTLNQPLQRQLGRRAVSQTMRDFAKTFKDLQEARHLADYDPRAVFTPSNVRDIITETEIAVAAFDNAPPDEQADILALLMVRPRP